MTRERAGVLFCLVSAAAFSSSTIFGRFAFQDGVGVLTLLALRYGGAVLLFWGLVWLTRQRLPNDPIAALRVLGLGAALLSLQAALFYSSLERLDAGLTVLLLYTFPAMVATATAAAFRRLGGSRRIATAPTATIAGKV